MTRHIKVKLPLFLCNIFLEILFIHAGQNLLIFSLIFVVFDKMDHKFNLETVNTSILCKIKRYLYWNLNTTINDKHVLIMSMLIYKSNINLLPDLSKWLLKDSLTIFDSTSHDSTYQSLYVPWNDKNNHLIFLFDFPKHYLTQTFQLPWKFIELFTMSTFVNFILKCSKAFFFSKKFQIVQPVQNIQNMQIFSYVPMFLNKVCSCIFSHKTNAMHFKYEYNSPYV